MKEKVYNVPAVLRAIKILDFIKENDEATFTDIHTALGVPKGSVYQILSTLKDNRLVEVRDGKYILGLKLFELGSAVSQRFDIKKIALPILKELTEETNLTSHLGVLQETEGVFLEKVESSSVIILRTWVGERIKLHSSATGKVLLAFQERDKRDKMLEQIILKKYTENTTTDKEKLKAELELIIKNGYCIDNEESQHHIFGIGAPIFDSKDKIVAAISLGGLVTEVNMSNYKEFIKPLKEASREVSYRLGNI